jgi:peptide/nickel transport system substrate-binding protein
MGPACVDPPSSSPRSPRPRCVADVVIVLVVVLGVAGIAPARSEAAPDGQIVTAVHVTLAPTWFDPAEAPGLLTPYLLFYALHDALVKPMPGRPVSPSLAASWSTSSDGLVHEFVLRKGVRFHNGEPVTADDVKFSFDRYRGVAARQLKDHVQSVETENGRVRFRLKKPWPDFMTYYTNSTAADWIVPKKYVENVGDEGFKKAPVGAGPYRFVSFTPGVELVLEAFEGYWRKAPSVKRLVFRVIPDESARLAALKRGEVDIAYSLRAALAEELQRTKGLTLKATFIQSPVWIYFADQWDPKSPWHDRRLRLAVSHAIDRETINQAETLGFSKVGGSGTPTAFEFFWQPPVHAYDVARARKLLGEAGYPGGLDAGDYFCDLSYANVGEAVINYLAAVGIRARLRSLERAAFYKGYREKTFRNLIQSTGGAFGNAATRLEAYVATGGAFAYGGAPDLDRLMSEQAVELDRSKREATLHRIQQLVHERVLYAPIWWQLAFLNGVGPRVAESGLGLIPGYTYSAPYEDMKLSGN